MVYSQLEKCQKRCTVVGKVTQVVPSLEIEYKTKRKQVVCTEPVRAKINDWVRVFGVSKHRVILADALHTIDPSDVFLFSLFRRRVRTFHLEHT